MAADQTAATDVASLLRKRDVNASVAVFEQDCKRGFKIVRFCCPDWAAIGSTDKGDRKASLGGFPRCNRVINSHESFLPKGTRSIPLNTIPFNLGMCTLFRILRIQRTLKFSKWRSVTLARSSTVRSANHFGSRISLSSA